MNFFLKITILNIDPFFLTGAKKISNAVVDDDDDLICIDEIETRDGQVKSKADDDDSQQVKKQKVSAITID